MGQVDRFKTKHRQKSAKERVAFLGFGVANASASRAIGESKYKLALEAMPDWGGRVYTINLEGLGPVQGGASWEHTPERDSDFHKQPTVFNAEYSPDTLSEIRVFINGRLVDPQAFNAAFDQADQRINSYTGGSQTLKDRLTATRISYMGAFFRNQFADSDAGLGLKKVSVAACKFEHATNTGNFHMRGFRAVIEDLFSETIAQTEILYNTAVKEIHYGKTPHKIVTYGGDAYYSEYTVTSASVGVLKSGIIEFYPQLPKPYIRALDGLEMGLVEKFYVKISDSFIINHSIPHNLQINILDRSRKPLFAVARPAGKNVIMFLTGGNTTQKLLAMSEREIGEFFISALRECFGMDFQIEGFAHTNNSGNPFWRGSYSLEKPGHHRARNIFKKPLNNLFFAGEGYLHDPFAGQVPAAYKSGTEIGNIISQSQLGKPALTDEEKLARKIEAKLSHRERLEAKKARTNGFARHL